MQKDLKHANLQPVHLILIENSTPCSEEMYIDAARSEVRFNLLQRGSFDGEIAVISHSVAKDQ